MSAKRRQRTPNGKKTPVTSTDLNATYTPPPTATKSPQGTTSMMWGRVSRSLKSIQSVGSSKFAKNLMAQFHLN